MPLTRADAAASMGRAEVAGAHLGAAAGEHGRDRLLRVAVPESPPRRAARRDPGEFPGPDAAIRRQIAERLAERRDDMVAAMMRELQRSLPGYWRLRGTGHEVDHRAMSTAMLDLFITLLRENRSLSPQEERTLRAIAARRGRQGVAVERLTASVGLAARAGWRYVVECGMELGSEPAVLATIGKIAEDIADFCNVTLQIMSPAYLTPWGAELGVAEVLAEVLSGPELDSTPAGMAQVERLSAGLHSPHGLLLVTRLGSNAQGVADAARAAVDQLLARIPGAVDVPVSSGLTAHSTVAVPAVSPDWHWERALLEEAARECNALIFATAPATGPVRLRAVYERATSLLSVARAVFETPRVVEDVDLRLYGLLVACTSGHEHFVDEVLGPILALPVKQRDRLLETIAALRDTPLKGGLRAAARTLEVHEKTVAYRIQRIVELTSLDPDLPDHRTQLTVALDLLRLAGWSVGAGLPGARDIDHPVERLLRGHPVDEDSPASA